VTDDLAFAFGSFAWDSKSTDDLGINDQRRSCVGLALAVDDVLRTAFGKACPLREIERGLVGPECDDDRAEFGSFFPSKLSWNNCSDVLTRRDAVLRA
jgi:hypothetical protein